MALTDIKIKTAKPRDKDYKLGDNGGLYLLVTKSGGKLWRLKYRVEGKEKLLTFGAYPTISLLEARAKREEAKKILANGSDPNKVKKEVMAEKKASETNTFKLWATLWFEHWRSNITSNHAAYALRRLDSDMRVSRHSFGNF